MVKLKWISWNAVCGQSRTYWCKWGGKGKITLNPYLSISTNGTRFFTTMKINSVTPKKDNTKDDPTHSLKKWIEHEFNELWIGLTGLRTSMDSPVYFHSLW
jgi:hypothetical protein